MSPLAPPPQPYRPHHHQCLRYVNVFAPHQDPNQAYAALIPKWIAALIKGETVYINCDGETSRCFCFLANAVQANLLVATTTNADSTSQVYKVAVSDQTKLSGLFALLRDCLAQHGVSPDTQPLNRDFRNDDVRHSQAAIGKAKTTLLGYVPMVRIAEGIVNAMRWYI